MFIFPLRLIPFLTLLIILTAFNSAAHASEEDDEEVREARKTLRSFQRLSAEDQQRRITRALGPLLQSESPKVRRLTLRTIREAGVEWRSVRRLVANILDSDGEPKVRGEAFELVRTRVGAAGKAIPTARPNSALYEHGFAIAARYALADEIPREAIRAALRSEDAKSMVLGLSFVEELTGVELEDFRPYRAEFPKVLEKLLDRRTSLSSSDRRLALVVARTLAEDGEREGLDTVWNRVALLGLTEKEVGIKVRCLQILIAVRPAAPRTAMLVNALIQESDDHARGEARRALTILQSETLGLHSTLVKMAARGDSTEQAFAKETLARLAPLSPRRDAAPSATVADLLASTQVASLVRRREAAMELLIFHPDLPEVRERIRQMIGTHGAQAAANLYASLAPSQRALARREEADLVTGLVEQILLDRDDPGALHEDAYRAIVENRADASLLHIACIRTLADLIH